MVNALELKFSRVLSSLLMKISRVWGVFFFELSTYNLKYIIMKIAVFGLNHSPCID
jgi:hypothetical protein